MLNAKAEKSLYNQLARFGSRERQSHMRNERITEALVRSRLRKSGYFDEGHVRVEEQKSAYPRILKLLRVASKRGTGAGFPDFIISSEKQSDFLIVVECKAEATKHRSQDGNRYAEYAVDGALLYADYLATDFDVLAVAVSGQRRCQLNNFALPAT